MTSITTDTTKKIVVISPAHPLRGGIAASSERLALALQEAGNEVVIYSFSLQYPSFLFPGKTQFTDDPAPANLRIETKINSVNPFNWIASARAIAREQPDLIVCRFWMPFMGPCQGSVLRMARWWNRKKCKVTALVDNIIPHEKRPGDGLFARYFIGACDRFVVMSQSVGKEIETHFGVAASAIRFAPHPVYDTYGEKMDKQAARAELGLDSRARIVLFFGFIRAYKGLDLLLQALALTPDIQLIVAGECYEDWAPYQAIIDQLQLNARVHLHTDFIAADKVRVFFGAADLVVQPYKTATQSGISQIAYHFDKPMIVTCVGGLPEIVKDGVSGYVVETEPQAIADAMRDYFEHDREAEFSEGVRSEKHRFSWEYLCTQLITD